MFLKTFLLLSIAEIIVLTQAKKHRSSLQASTGHKGRSNGAKHLGSKIVGGYSTTIEDQPYQTYLLTEDGDGTTYECGGSLISEEWILTAAHCMDGIVKVYVRLGSTDRDKGGQTFESSDYKIHPHYDTSNTNNDVAVLKLSVKAKLSDTVKIIKINDEGKEVPEGTVITVSGWGVTEEDGSDIPEELRAVQVIVKSRKECENILHITPEMLCANDKGKDSCQGDSGGPAVEGDTKNNPLQVGIVSFGVGCAEKDYLGVYTNIASKSVREFIRITTQI